MLRKCFWHTVLFSLVVIALQAVAWAQEGGYQEDPLNTDRSEDARLRGVTFGVLRGTDEMAGKEADIDRYLNEFIFPHFTRMKSLPRIGDFRTSFRRMLWSAKTPQSLERLNTRTLEKMTAIVAGNYHPYSKYHAMLMIGDLNQQNPDTRNAGVPYRPAFETLRQGVAGNTDAPVKVAALIGLIRHAGSGLPAAEAAALRDQMVALAADKQVPKGRTADTHEWIRRRAIDVLAALRDPGQNGAVLAALDRIVAGDDESLETRGTAAYAIARLDMAAAGKLDPSKVARDLGRFAVDAYTHEIALTAKTSEASPSADRLRTNLLGAKQALTGPEGNSQAGLAVLAAEAPQTELLTQLVAGIDGVLKALGDKSITRTTAADLRKAGQQLEAALGAGAAPAEPAPPARAAAARPGSPLAESR